MRRRSGLLAAWPAFLLAHGAPAATPPCPPVAPEAISAPAMAEAVALGREVRIVALGSSSTEGVGGSGAAWAYPALLEARLREALPGVAVRVVNRGVAGEDVVAMAGRIDTAVIPERPALVIWQVGANAALSGMPPGIFRAHLQDGLLRLRRAGIDVVLMDNQRAPRIAARGGHRALDRILAEAAARIPGVSLFSRGRLMDAWAREGTPPGALIAADGLHHNDRGYGCVAVALAAAILRGLPAMHQTDGGS